MPLTDPLFHDLSAIHMIIVLVTELVPTKWKENNIPGRVRFLLSFSLTSACK